MRLLIIEDELPIAEYVARLCRTILKERLTSVDICTQLDEARAALFEQPVDLCLLDLNLSGEDGYDLLKSAVSGAFHTIVISANTDRAVEAFQYGVLDFVPKPFSEKRLRQAFGRYFERQRRGDISTRYLATRKEGRNIVFTVEDVLYFKAADIYVEAHFKNGRMEILDKTMERLGQILPDRFMRTHRSYYVDLTRVAAYRHAGGGSYQLTLQDGTELPLSRQKYKDLHVKLNY